MIVTRKRIPEEYIHLFPGKRYYRGSKFRSRFHYDLTAIIENTISGDEIACTNVVTYYRGAIHLKNPVRAEVVQYLVRAIKELSPSERVRTTRALKVDEPDASAEALLAVLTRFSSAARNRFIKKISAVPGQPPKADNDFEGHLRDGSKVAKLHKKYSDRDSLEYDQTQAMGLEPLERAIQEVNEKTSIGWSPLRKRYRLFKRYSEWGCVDSDGRLIFS